MPKRKREEDQPESAPKKAKLKDSAEDLLRETKIFNDSIHGQIELPLLLVKIIDTPQFQRLRHLKQLGMKYLIYPGATHTRFEHSIGVAYLAGRLVKNLREKQSELNITAEDVLCVQIAGLCHDLGHGPFSHLFDGMFIPEVQQVMKLKWEHEDASVEMFLWMLEKNKLMEDKGDTRIIKQDITFIKELIRGVELSDDQWRQSGRTEDKSFLYEIVANKRNGIDVDKWDYLARDCHHLGIPNGFDLRRLLKSARVCKVNGGSNRKSICFRDKVADNIYDMFHTRYTLHRQALRHKIGYIIDVKITEALVKANGNLYPDRKISDAIKDMSQYTILTDHVFDEMMNTKNDLAGAKEILENIVSRCLPKFVGEARLMEVEEIKQLMDLRKKSKTTYKGRLKEWGEKIIKMHNDNVNQIQLAADDLEICVFTMGFGEVGKNPIDKVYFYSKRDPDKAFKMGKYEVSSLRPEKFKETLVRVYYKNTQKNYQKVQQSVEDSFHEWCLERKDIIYSSTHSQEGKIYSDSASSVSAHSQKEMKKQNLPNKLKIKFKIFTDSIHGQIELHPLLVKIIDTPQFQRLRQIKQLGAKSYIFPGATHTRFEHSIGMSHLAGCLAKVLQEQLMDQGLDEAITNQDILCVQIAALCYNLGHGPFSHLFDLKYMPEVLKPDETWKHQTASVWLFLDILEKLKNEREKEAFELDEDDLIFIRELILGAPDQSNRKNKSYLYEIVNNTWNGIDVRRWDYFARDCHHLGLSNGFDHQRLLKSARVCVVDKKKHICFRDKVADNIYDMFHNRYTLYRQAYQHKIGNIIEDKIAKALKAKVNVKFSEITESRLQIDISRKIPRIINGKSAKKTSVDRAMKEYTKLTDNIFEDILYSTNEELKNSKKELEDIVKRNLPKFVGEARLPRIDNQQTLQMIQKTLQGTWETTLIKSKCLGASDFIIDVVEMDHGMKQEDPFENVCFYNKRNPDEAFKIKKYQVSSLQAVKFKEQCVRVYYKKSDEKELQDAVKCFKIWCFENFGLPRHITFYKEENFKGEKYAFMGNEISDLTKHLKSCRSLCVSGIWEVCEDTDFKGPVRVLTTSDYPKFPNPHFPQNLHFCRIPSWEIHLYNWKDFDGDVHVVTEDCFNLEEVCGITEVHSCNVIAGTWKLHEGLNYTGEHYFVFEGSYPRYENWNAPNPIVKSLKHE